MEVSEYGNPSAENVLLFPVDGSEAQVIEAQVSLIRKNTDRDFKLLAFLIRDWNRELSPWEAPPVFGKEGFGGGASATLEEILRCCKDRSKNYYIGGYSLAGLFSLWAAYQNDIFRGIAAASPSMWFPGFDDMMLSHKIKTGSVYLSLGNKEEKAKNPVMATVGDKIRKAYSLLLEEDVNCILEWNEGNHFKDIEIRMAKAFSWILQF